MKIRFSWWWLPFVGLCLINHMQKVMLFIFGMLAIHECAHLLVARFFHYELGPVIIYPFGLGAHIYHMGHGSVWKEILIAIAGPLTHFGFPFVFMLFYQWSWISASFYHYLIQINTAILLFNTLLIWPLDGGRVMQSFFHLWLPFKWAQRLTFMASVFNMGLLFMGHIILNASSMIVFIFLFFQILMGWKQLSTDRFQFYLYRLMHPCHYRLKIHRRGDIYRQRENMMEMEKGWMDEKTWLRTQLSKQATVNDSHSSYMI